MIRGILLLLLGLCTFQVSQALPLGDAYGADPQPMAGSRLLQLLMPDRRQDEDVELDGRLGGFRDSRRRDDERDGLLRSILQLLLDDGRRDADIRGRFDDRGGRAADLVRRLLSLRDEDRRDLSDLVRAALREGWDGRSRRDRRDVSLQAVGGRSNGLGDLVRLMLLQSNLGGGGGFGRDDGRRLELADLIRLMGSDRGDLGDDRNIRDLIELSQMLDRDNGGRRDAAPLLLGRRQEQDARERALLLLKNRREPDCKDVVGQIIAMKAMGERRSDKSDDMHKFVYMMIMQKFMEDGSLSQDELMKLMMIKQMDAEQLVDMMQFMLLMKINMTGNDNQNWALMMMMMQMQGGGGGDFDSTQMMLVQLLQQMIEGGTAPDAEKVMLMLLMAKMHNERQHGDRLGLAEVVRGMLLQELQSRCDGGRLGGVFNPARMDSGAALKILTNALQGRGRSSGWSDMMSQLMMIMQLKN